MQMCWRLAKVIFTTLLYRLSMHASSFMPAVVLQALRKCGINRMTDWQTDTGISGNKPLAVRKKVSEWSQWRGRAVRVPGPPSGVLAVLTVHYDCHSVKIETELLICSIACHSLHEKWLCIFMLTKPASVESPDSFAVPLFPISPLLLLLFFVFPDLSVLSTLSLGQIRLSCIPDIPAAYVRNSIWLLWARIVSSTPFFPSLCSLPIACLSTHLHLDCPGWGFTVRFDPPHPLLFISGCIIQEREVDRTGGFCQRPWDRLIYR